MAAREHFSSRWGLLLAAIGMAVGTGNIWRFPRVAAANGGGAFVVAWLVALMLWSMPLILVELALGRVEGKGVVGAISRLTRGKMAWAGGFVALCTAGIMFYYSVVTGWCLRYLVMAVGGDLGGDAEALWEVASSGTGALTFHTIAAALGAGIILFGVTKGIERANKILIPSLFVLLVAAAVRAVMLPGAGRGLEYLFSPDFSALADHKVWLEAFSQSAWSTGAGWGLLLTYAVYSKRKRDLSLEGLTTGLGNNSASLLAAIAIIATVFASLPEGQALEVMASGNEGLAFIWMPKIFAGDSSVVGRVMTIAFFLALCFAAISSLISMTELASRVLMDMGFSRKRAVLMVFVATVLLGAPSAMWMGAFKNQDWVWGLGLLVSGLLIAVAVMVHGVGRFRKSYLPAIERSRVGRVWFSVTIYALIPVAFVAMVGWWFWSARSWDPEGWLAPFERFSVGTVLLQWGLVIGALVLVQLIFGRRRRGGP